MGRRGPAPAPTALKVIRGDRKDRIKDDEPVPASGEVVMPSWLGKDARAVWRGIAPDLDAAGVLTPWDVEGLASWCHAVARQRRAAAVLDREGEVIEAAVFDKNGTVTGSRLARSPWCLVLKDATDVMLRYGARFGLTPSDRSQLPSGKGAGRPRGLDRYLTPPS